MESDERVPRRTRHLSLTPLEYENGDVLVQLFVWLEAGTLQMHFSRVSRNDTKHGILKLTGVHSKFRRSVTVNTTELCKPTLAGECS